jgi:hypothetical protein
MAKQTFTTGQVLTANDMTSLQQTAMGGGSATAKTANYVLVAADAGTTVIMNSGSATTITVNTSLFAAGDTVFIVNQGAGVCTITAGTATVSTAGSLAMGQNETGQLYFLSTSAAIFTEYTQSAAAGGKVLQVINTTYAVETASTSNTYADTGLTATITPTSATSKILVIVTQQGVQKNSVNANNACDIRLLRASTTILQMGDGNGATGSTVNNLIGSVSASYLDSPATTSAITYKTQFRNSINAATVRVQSWAVTADTAVSTITLMEIGA